VRRLFEGKRLTNFTTLLNRLRHKSHSKDVAVSFRGRQLAQGLGSGKVRGVLHEKIPSIIECKRRRPRPTCLCHFQFAARCSVFFRTFGSICPLSFNWLFFESSTCSCSILGPRLIHCSGKFPNVSMSAGRHADLRE